MGSQVSTDKLDRAYPLLTAAIAKVEKPDKLLRYGTAGFRDKAELLDSTTLRMGVLAALRSKHTGLPVGIMVTASHNPECDNGLKIVDPGGGMLSRSWEGHAEALANAGWKSVTKVLAGIYEEEGMQLEEVPKEACCTGDQEAAGKMLLRGVKSNKVVFIGRDTRKHSQKLVLLAKQGVELLGGEVRDVGVVTTPQLHHCVRMATGMQGEEDSTEWVGRYWGQPEWALESGYYLMLGEAFQAMLETQAFEEQEASTGPTANSNPQKYGAFSGVMAGLAGLLLNNNDRDKDKDRDKGAEGGSSNGNAGDGSVAGGGGRPPDRNSGKSHAEMVAQSPEAGRRGSAGGRRESLPGSRKGSITGRRGSTISRKETSGIVVDGACGVGALKVVRQVEAISRLCAPLADSLALEVVNGVGDGALNEGCGAEYVQKKASPPKGFTAEKYKGKTICSFDGDADRVVFHCFDEGGYWHLADGDKIAALIATFLAEELEVLNLSSTFSLACVQTAYANGASTTYLKAHGVQCAMVKTGVKFLHEEAEKYDVGVYFEANGHGTVLFSEGLKYKIALLEKQLDQVESVRQELAVKRLAATRRLANQATGDAISDMLLVESILALKCWAMPEWCSMYDDLPSRQANVAVADRAVVKCSEDESRVIQPPELQDALDREMQFVQGGRCFVRPSGTEDVVRVYAEAVTQTLADGLAAKAVHAIREYAGGLTQAQPPPPPPPPPPQA